MVPKLSLEGEAGVGELATGAWVDGAVGIKMLSMFLTLTMIKNKTKQNNNK